MFMQQNIAERALIALDISATADQVARSSFHTRRIVGETFALLLPFIADSSAAAVVDDADACWMHDVCAAGCSNCRAMSATLWQRWLLMPVSKRVRKFL